MRSTTLSTVAGMVAVLALGGAGCGGDSGGEKSGGQTSPATLRLGTVEGESAPYSDEVEEFAKTVDQLTAGSVHVEIVWEAAGPYTGESEQELAAMVGNGEIDLAVVPTRVWDQLGVTSFQALQAPFLVDSLNLLNDIATGDLAGEMLAGLDTVGVEGLAIWPESLRHPISFDEPLVTATDFRGAKLRVPSSDASLRLARAIGIEPVDVNPPDWPAAVASGELQGAESAFVWANDLPQLGTITANITFYPKANTIVANAETFTDLSGDHQDALQRAATATLSHVVETNATEQSLAAEYCASGGRVALADEIGLAELVELADPVLAELEQDDDTRRIIDEIRAVKNRTRTDAIEPLQACEPTDQASATDASADPEDFPEGVYRVESEAGGDTVVITMSLVDGVWEGYLNNELDCAGTYVIEAGRIWMSNSTDAARACGNPPGMQFLDAAWTFENDELRFVDINSDPNAVRDFGSQPWTKIE